MSEKENKGGRPKSGKNPFTEIFGKLVGEGATQQEIADKIGVTRQNVGKWLSGITTPDIVTLVKIADAYGVSTDYLLGRTDIKTDNIDKKAVCDYIGLSEMAVDNIVFHCKYNNPADDEYTRNLKKLYSDTTNRIINSGIFWDMIYSMEHLERQSYIILDDKWNITFNDVLRMAETLKIKPTQILKVLGCNKSEGELITEHFIFNGDIGAENICDNDRYNLIKCSERISNKFDHRKDYLKYSRAELLEYLNITEEQLKQLQAETEQEG